MKEEFIVHTDTFEGPLQHLLEIIERHKLSINEVSLSQITDEYIAYIQTVENIDSHELSRFIVVAATLMLIKSRSLLPELPITAEEETEIEALEERLKTLLLVQELSSVVKKHYGASVLRKRPYITVRKQSFSPPPSLDKNTLLEAVSHALLHIPKEEMPKVATITPTIKIEKVLRSLMERVTKEARMRFSDFTKEGEAIFSTTREIRVFLVVSFLSMLELIKNGTLEAEQDMSFGEITLTS